MNKNTPHDLENSLKIALLSLADINNYGDTFFPYVFRAEIQRRLPNAKIELITNTAFDCGLYKTTAYSKEYVSQFDAVIYCGGELISPYDNKTFLKAYANVGYQGVPSDIAHGWMDLGKTFKAWFAVGAHPVLFDYPIEVDAALSNLDYISVRGTISKKVLEKGYIVNNGDIRVIPDSGWVFPKYIDEYANANTFINELKDQQYIAFEAIDDLDIGTNAEMIAKALVSFQKTTNVKVILVPIIQATQQWFELITLQKIHDAADGLLTLLPEGLNILEIGTILKNAKFFVGSSMHGAVTSLAYGKPAVNIRGAINTKLQDLHAARFRSVCFANDWSVLPGVLERLNNESENETDRKYNLMYAEYMRYRLSREIDGLCARMQSYFEKS